VLPVQNGLKQGDALSPLLLNFSFEGSGRKVPENYEESGSTEHIRFRSAILMLIYHTHD
jgi:hypothetical protein